MLSKHPVLRFTAALLFLHEYGSGVFVFFAFGLKKNALDLAVFTSRNFAFCSSKRVFK